MNKLAFSIPAILCATLSFGQKTFEFKLPEATTPQTCLYENFKVLDQRTDKTSIGYVKKGGKKKIPLVTAQPLDTYLSEYYSAAMTSPSKADLVAVIYDLTVEEMPGDAPVGTIHFDMDIYCSVTGRYSLICTVDTFYEVTGKKDLTNKLVRSAGNLLTKCLVDISMTNVLGRTIGFYRWEEIAPSRALRRKTFPIYKASNARNGIYYSKMEFLYNKPSDTTFMAENAESADKLSLRAADKDGTRGEKIDPHRYFAVCCNGKWYAGGGDRPVMMEQRDGEFYMVKPFTGMPQQEGSADGATVYTIAAATAGNEGAKTNAAPTNYISKLDPVQQRFKPVRRVGKAQ